MPSVTDEQLDTMRRVREGGGSVRAAAKAAGVAASTAARHFPDASVQGKPDRLDSVLDLLKKRALPIELIARYGDSTIETARAWIALQQARGINLHQFGELYSIEDYPEVAADDPVMDLMSNENDEFLVGACGDQHLCSKYERLDCLNDLYDEYEQAGIKHVFNTGNWIDGEARFNKFDLHTHGMGRQLQYLAEHYPRRAAITTWAVSGDDHEGWYGQREGVDIGKYAEHAMHDAGRTDWRHLGFIEAHVRLVNARTGKSSYMSVMHPGGGTAYAISYQPQKLVESLEGGEKPAVMLLGHYHKLSSNNIRNVWVVQTGTTQDQTPFMKKKRIDAHVGGLILKFKQDPETGAITRFMPDMIRYFNRGYYGNKRWSYVGDVELPARV